MPPSVTTNGGTLSLVIASPCSQPQAVPMAQAASSASGQPQPCASASVPTAKRLSSPPLATDRRHPSPASATTEPTDRSMPRVRMTKVMPIASRP